MTALGTKDPEIKQVHEDIENAGGNFADSHSVNCSDEQLDLYGADGYRAELNVDLSTKDNLFTGQQKTPEAADNKDNQSTRSKLFRCQMAFLPATIEFDTDNFASSFVQNLIENNGIAINSSNRAEANEILGEMDEYLAENPEDAARIQGLYDVAARNEHGQVFLTEEEKMDWEAENLNVCTINPTMEDIVDHVESGSDSRFSYLESTRPDGAEQVAKADFVPGGG